MIDSDLGLSTHVRRTPRPLRVAAFGFRSVPPTEGSAGADKFALELYPRLVKRGCSVTAYNRLYGKAQPANTQYNGVSLVYLRTVSKSGFDTLCHSLKATLHILSHNTGEIVHIHNGGNSIWALPLRLFGKKVFVSQDGVDWRREKWPWYGRFYLYFSSFVTAYLPNGVIFDNVYAKQFFERKFKRRFSYIAYGCETAQPSGDKAILTKLGLKPKEYFLFVGRFIPDKGVHYLLEAFERIETTRKLVLVGGSPHASSYEQRIRKTLDPRVVLPGYVYGADTAILMQNAYAYVQPSDVEGLSPVVLSVMGLGVPLICSNIPENLFAVADTALTFEKSNVDDLAEAIRRSLQNPDDMNALAIQAKQRALRIFSWNRAVEEHLNVFAQSIQGQRGTAGEA